MSNSMIDWHLFEKGDRAKPGVIFLHGFMGASSVWKPIIDQLYADYHCVAVDLPGHGETEADLVNLDFEKTSSEIIKLCSRKFSNPPVICGYSMGGRIALYTALNHPDSFRGMMLESVNPGIEIGHEKKIRFLSDSDWAQKLSRSTMRQFLVEWYAQPLFSYLPDDLIARIIEKKSSGNPANLAKTMLIYSQGSQPSLWRKLAGWKTPALVIAGELDEKYCQIAKRIGETLPDWELCVVPEAGHIVHLEKPNRFISALKSWLDRSIL